MKGFIINTKLFIGLTGFCFGQHDTIIKEDPLTLMLDRLI